MEVVCSWGISANADVEQPVPLRTLAMRCHDDSISTSSAVVCRITSCHVTKGADQVALHRGRRTSWKCHDASIFHQDRLPCFGTLTWLSIHILLQSILEQHQPSHTWDMSGLLENRKFKTMWCPIGAQHDWQTCAGRSELFWSIQIVGSLPTQPLLTLKFFIYLGLQSKPTKPYQTSI